MAEADANDLERLDVSDTTVEASVVAEADVSDDEGIDESDAAEADASVMADPSTTDDVVGRPRVDVDLDVVEFLASLKLSLTKVASLLGVSRSTIYRRMMEEGRVIGSYTPITDTALDLLIQRLKLDHPHDGEVMIAGHLTRIGVRVPRARLRASIHRVDPLGVAERSRHVICRRVYSVPHANYVWHIDSHHKLIRWR